MDALAKLPVFGAIFLNVFSLLMILLPLVLDQEVQGGSGAQKKEQVVGQVNALIDQPGGLDWPAWFPSNLRPVLLGILIDLLVKFANKTGFFKPSQGN